MRSKHTPCSLWRVKLHSMHHNPLASSTNSDKLFVLHTYLPTYHRVLHRQVCDHISFLLPNLDTDLAHPCLCLAFKAGIVPHTFSYLYFFPSYCRHSLDVLPLSFFFFSSCLFFLFHFIPSCDLSNERLLLPAPVGSFTHSQQSRHHDAFLWRPATTPSTSESSCVHSPSNRSRALQCILNHPIVTTYHS